MSSLRRILVILRVIGFLGFLGSVLFLVTGPHTTIEVGWAFTVMWPALLVYLVVGHVPQRHRGR